MSARKARRTGLKLVPGAGIEPAHLLRDPGFKSDLGPYARPNPINDLVELLRKSRPSPLSTITPITLCLFLIGTI